MAYSFVGIQTLYLATNFPEIYWNCACLIVNAGGSDLLESDSNDEDNDEKKKNKTVNYGKIAAAIGESISKGIKVLPPDINKSDLIFIPSIRDNAIIYGMKGITRIGTQLVYEIFDNRPYTSLEDFLSKVKINKIQMISLIKSGAFDNLYNGNRVKIMEKYLDTVSDKKKRITLQNMQMLIDKNLLPQEFDYEKRLFNFNKYLKSFKKGQYYILDEIALNFFNENYDDSLLEDVNVGNNQSASIKQNIWDNIYKKGMDKIREWFKDNQEEILNKLNSSLLDETYQKYAGGSISQWEMESLSFYYHPHELAKIKYNAYGISNFSCLNPEPEIERSFETKEGTEINIFQLNRIAGTVIDKDKNKSQIILLTVDGSVITVKIWKNQYAVWDKQISQRDNNGVKHVIEKSWFTKGTKLIITGIRRGDTFVPKKYKSTEWPLFEKIEEIDENGYIKSSAIERIEIDE